MICQRRQIGLDVETSHFTDIGKMDLVDQSIHGTHFMKMDLLHIISPK